MRGSDRFTCKVSTTVGKTAVVVRYAVLEYSYILVHSTRRHEALRCCWLLVLLCCCWYVDTQKRIRSELWNHQSHRAEMEREEKDGITGTAVSVSTTKSIGSCSLHRHIIIGTLVFFVSTHGHHFGLVVAWMECRIVQECYERYGYNTAVRLLARSISLLYDMHEYSFFLLLAVQQTSSFEKWWSRTPYSNVDSNVVLQLHYCCRLGSCVVLCLYLVLYCIVWI